MLDKGIGRGDVATGAIAYVIIVFNSIAIYNVVELTFIIWTTFKRRGGLYWWSFNVATYGIALYSAGYILMNEKPFWNSWLYATLVAVGWPMMVTGQSMVLYSRLHLILLDRKVLRCVLWMIIFNAIIGHVPTIVFIYGANLNDPGPWITPYSIYEKVQVTIFFLQECIISGLYISETIKMMKLQRDIRSRKASQRLLKYLIFINVLIIAFDVTILGLEYSRKYDVQTSYKAMVYAAKLKLEFSILNQLVEVTMTRKDVSDGSPLSATAANAVGFPIELNDDHDDHDDDGVREGQPVRGRERGRDRRRPPLSYRAPVRGGQDPRRSSSQDPTRTSMHSGVTLTREVEVRTEERRLSDGDSMVEMRAWIATVIGGGAMPMREVETRLKSCSQVHLAPEPWPADMR